MNTKHHKQLGISYGEKEYWENKYASDTTFEWYMEYRHISHIIKNILTKLNPQNALVFTTFD